MYWSIFWDENKWNIPPVTIYWRAMTGLPGWLASWVFFFSVIPTEAAESPVVQITPMFILCLWGSKAPRSPSTRITCHYQLHLSSIYRDLSGFPSPRSFSCYSILIFHTCMLWSRKNDFYFFMASQYETNRIMSQSTNSQLLFNHICTHVTTKGLDKSWQFPEWEGHTFYNQ